MKPFTSADIRFTTKGDALYAIALDIPTTAVTIKSLSLKSNNGTVASVELLGSNEKIIWSQKADALVIQLSKNYPSENAVSFKISFKK